MAKKMKEGEVTQEGEAIAPVVKAALPTNFIKVRPTKGYMFEPFQRIAIQEQVETPVLLSDWVISQIEAGLLEKC